MDYQVWKKEEYGDTFTKVDCGDLEAARREIDKAVREGREPLLTVEVPYELNIKVKEIGSETKESKAKRDKDTRAESKGKDRPGDADPSREVDPGMGDPGSGDSVPSQ